MGHRVVIKGDDLSGQPAADFLFQGSQQFPGLVFAVSPGCQADFDEARPGIHGQGRVRLPLDQIHELFFNKSFAQVVNLDVPRSDASLAAKGLEQPRLQTVFIHPAHLCRRPRQVDQGLAALLHGHARCRPGAVIEEYRSLRDHGLALLVLGHGRAAVMTRSTRDRATFSASSMRCGLSPTVV